MWTRKRFYILLLSLVGMILLIFEGRTVSQGAAEGVEICIRTIVPSLFPFFVLTTYLQPQLLNFSFPGPKALRQRLHIPTGQESILILGLLAGYPVGAQLIAESYRNGQLTKENAHIMMGYCNHAGPAFLFGITSRLFESAIVPWCLWGIHLLSAVSTLCILPRCVDQPEITSKTKAISFPQALRTGITICGCVCGWIVLFKAFLTILNKWLPEALSPSMLIVISGILELSNGCLGLFQISEPSIRFILCSLFLGFGGLCIAMQALSVCSPLGLGLYFPGKVIETLISSILAYPIACILFSEIPFLCAYWIVYVLFSGMLIFFIQKQCRKKLWKLQNA